LLTSHYELNIEALKEVPVFFINNIYMYVTSFVLINTPAVLSFIFSVISFTLSYPTVFDNTSWMLNSNIKY